MSKGIVVSRRGRACDTCRQKKRKCSFCTDEGGQEGGGRKARPRSRSRNDGEDEDDSTGGNGKGKQRARSESEEREDTGKGKKRAGTELEDEPVAKRRRTTSKWFPLLKAPD